jgi:hypothetical protein
MPFLSVNGLELPVAPDSFEERVREVGSTSQAYSGALRKTRRAVKRDCSFETPPMLASEALAWDGLLRGLGEAWSFDEHLYGSKGTGPSAGAAERNTGSPKFGAGCVRFTGSQSLALPFAATTWTVMFWRLTTGSYVHWLHTSATGGANGYADGVYGAAPGILTVSGGTATLADTDARVDDLVLLPFVVPAGWIAALGAQTAAWPSTPRLRAAGDAVSEAASRTCLGEVASSRLLQGVVGGAWHTNLRKLSVTLSEV